MTHTTTHRPRRGRKLAALATVLGAVGIAAATGATFTSSSANPSNSFSSGTLTQSNSKSGAAILTAANLKPGDSATGKVTITNTGSIPGSFTLSKSNATGGLLPVLSVVVTDETSNKQVYSGPLASMPSTALSGAFAAGDARTYRFDVTMAANADNTYQGQSASIEYDWDSVQ